MIPKTTISMPSAANGARLYEVTFTVVVDADEDVETVFNNTMHAVRQAYPVVVGGYLIREKTPGDLVPVPGSGMRLTGFVGPKIKKKAETIEVWPQNAFTLPERVT